LAECEGCTTKIGRLAKYTNPTVKRWASSGDAVEPGFAITTTIQRRGPTGWFTEPHDTGSPMQCCLRPGLEAKAATVSENQIALLQTHFPNHTVLSDIGSGLNFKRRGLQKVIRMPLENRQEDRLCRFAFRLCHVTLCVLCDSNDASAEQELASDVISIITVFGDRVTARAHDLVASLTDAGRMTERAPRRRPEPEYLRQARVYKQRKKTQQSQHGDVEGNGGWHEVEQ
jgi:hypothetical protein